MKGPRRDGRGSRAEPATHKAAAAAAMGHLRGLLRACIWDAEDADPGRVLTRGQLIDEIWGSDYVGDTKTLDVHIRRLRTRIEADPTSPVRIHTVRGVGYRFADT